MRACCRHTAALCPVSSRQRQPASRRFLVAGGRRPRRSRSTRSTRSLKRKKVRRTSRHRTMTTTHAMAERGLQLIKESCSGVARGRAWGGGVVGRGFEGRALAVALAFCRQCGCGSLVARMPWTGTARSGPLRGTHCVFGRFRAFRAGCSRAGLVALKLKNAYSSVRLPAATQKPQDCKKCFRVHCPVPQATLLLKGLRAFAPPDCGGKG
jgi:hypothetical protein